MKQSLIYSLNVWLTTAVIAPLLPLLLALIKHTETGVEMLILEWFMGWLISAPSFLILYLASNYLSKSHCNISGSKAILSLISIVLTYAPFLLINGYHLSLNPFLLSLFVSYGCTVLICVWCYRLNEAPSTDLISNTK
jgi:hypothetical protein